MPLIDDINRVVINLEKDAEVEWGHIGFLCGSQAF